MILKRSVVLCCLAVLLGLAGIGLSEEANRDPNTYDPNVMTLDRIFDPNAFKTEPSRWGRWLDDGSGYTVIEDSNDVEKGKDIVRYDPATGQRDILVSAQQLIPPGKSKPLGISGHTWSKDMTKLLIFTNTKRLWRTNTRGDYWVLDLTDNRFFQLGGDAEPSTLMFAKLSPDGRKVAYVRQHNIYVQDLKDLAITQLTRDGSESIINGTSDWVYEEEFRLRDGFRWSPNGTWIAYWQFDASDVPNFQIINNTDGLYPKITTFQYPKAGQTNSACKVGVVRAKGGPTRWFQLSNDPRNHYIPKMEWADNSRQIVIQHLNRLQNTDDLVLANVQNGRIRTILTERDDAWIDVTDCPKWFDDGKRFAWLSERDGWNRLYVVSRSGKEVTSLTPEKADVIDLVRIDDAGQWAFYMASPENATQSYLYRVALDGSVPAQRLTPVDQKGTHSYSISADGKWAFHSSSSFGVPSGSELVSLPDHKVVKSLADNSELRETLAAIDKGPAEFFRVDIGDGVELDGWCIKPPDFDPSKQYPVLFYVYGEPAGQTVLDRWGGRNYLWYLMLAQRGYIVMSVDNRGTPAPRGRQWRKSIYRQIGIQASADQAAAVRKIIETRPYVDPNRIGIWGWSGGGSMTLNAILRYPELYHTGMAVAFISDLRYYDTIYEERYMGLPDDNEEGYKNGSPITFAHQLEGNLLLVHGTADDNVHYQNCEALVNKFIEHKKYFSMMSYPNRTHGISEGKNTKFHVYSLLTRYLQEHMPPGPRTREDDK